MGITVFYRSKRVKNITRVTAVIIFMFAGLTAQNVQASTDDGEFALHSCFVKGIKEKLSCGIVDLPLNYSNEVGPTVPVHVAVLKATKPKSASDPLFILAGGPGQAASDYGSLVGAAFKTVNATRDIVLIDQRGTGRSYGMKCEADKTVQTLADNAKFIEKCLTGFELDVREFTMENVVKDMDAIRSLLGYAQVNLWGVSYGTRTADAYLKAYPENVRSIIVDGILPPDISLFETAPQSAHRALEKIIEDCENEPSCLEAFPNFKGQVFDLIEKSASGDLYFRGNDPLTGEPVDQLIEEPIAVESLRSVMYRSDGTTMLPYVVNEASKGNLLPLFAPLSSNAGAMYIGATLSMLCGDEVARVDPAAAKEAAEGSFAGDTYYRLWAQSCENWRYKKPSDTLYAPVNSDVPALLLSGDLDPITPPSMGEHYLKGLPNGHHIVVQGTGHNTSYVSCMPVLIAQFLNDIDPKALDTSCLDTMKRLPIIVGVNGNVQ